MSVSDTSMTLTSAASITANSLLSIDSEIVRVNGTPAGNVCQVTRGFDSTTVASHAVNAKVWGYVDAWHHNSLVSEVEAIEGYLLGGHGVSPLYVADDYDFTQSPGGSLTVGANSITLNPVPLGISTGSNVYISGGTGTAELAPVVGWNPSTGLMVVNCAYAHSGAWTISSASDGIQEAVTAAANNGTVVLRGHSYNVQATVMLKPGTVIIGSGKADVDPVTNPGGTTVNAASLTTGYVFDYLSPIKASSYGMSCGFVFRNFSIKTGLNGIRINNDTMPTGSNNQAFLTDNVVIEDVNIYGGGQNNSDPNKLTNAVPTLSTLKTFGVGFNLTCVFRARILDCGVYYTGVAFLIYGDENTIDAGLCSQNAVGVYIQGKDPNGNSALYGNKNIVRHMKFQGGTRLPMIWADWCGGTFIEHCYFEAQTGDVNQYVRTTNCMHFTFGPNNWVQSPFTASSCPSFHIDVAEEALIHNNTYLQGPNLCGAIEVDHHQYNNAYPNTVRCWNNGSFFPQPGNRSWNLSGPYSSYAQVPGVLVDAVNTLLLNAFNNPGDYAYNASSMPFIQDPVTNRWVITNADATLNANGLVTWFKQLPKRGMYRTFHLRVAARQTGTGQVSMNIQYLGNGTTMLWNGFLTFTSTAETSPQTSPDFSIPATETLNGSFQFTIIPAQAMVEQVELVPVS